MQTTVKLQDMFSYSFIGIIGLVLLFLALVVFLIVKYAKPKKPPVVRPIRIENIFTIKQKYVQILIGIVQKYQEKKISDRVAYQELSKAIRHFVYDVTGIRVQNYTLEEIRYVNMPNLYYLIAECYAPEFATDNDADFYQTIEKARKVIEEWN